MGLNGRKEGEKGRKKGREKGTERKREGDGYMRVKEVLSQG